MLTLYFFEILEKLIISYHFHPIKLTIKIDGRTPTYGTRKIRLSSRVLDSWLWASGSATSLWERFRGGPSLYFPLPLPRVSFPSDRQRSHAQLFYYASYLPVQRSPTHVIHTTRFCNTARRVSCFVTGRCGVRFRLSDRRVSTSFSWTPNTMRRSDAPTRRRLISLIH